MNNKEKLTKARDIEWQAALWGACVIAFSLGSLFSNYFDQLSLVLILLGIIVHSWGMYKIHIRNKE